MLLSLAEDNSLPSSKEEKDVAGEKGTY